MKALNLTLAGIMLLTLTFNSVKAQTKGNGNVTTEERQVSSFDAIKVSCAINLIVSQGEPQSVKVETDENLQSRIITKVSNGTLSLSCDNVNNATKLNVIVTVVTLSKIEASGASKVVTKTQIRSNDFGLYTSGAAKAIMDIDAGVFANETSGASNNVITLKANTAKTEISGAGTLALKGSADQHSTEVSGAGNLKALEFITDNTKAEVSGAGSARIMARKQLKADISGAGNITYFDKDNLKKISQKGEYQMTFDGMDNVKSIIIDDENGKDESSDKSWNFSDNNDSVSVVLNNKRIVIVTDDSVKVKLGQRDYVISDNGVTINKHPKTPKFKGHWAGFQLGVNGLLDNNMAIGSPAGYEFLDLNYAKSIAVNINFLEQNINLISQHLGLVTGMGISWNNYRFTDHNVVLSHEGEFDGGYDTDPARSYEKSKLVVSYLRVPLILELQTNSKMKANSFHIGGGVIGAVRLGSHSKIIYDGNKSKDRSDFYINPFKVDAVATIGWGVINLYGTYSLTEMFRSNKGPVAYPFEIGITLASF